MKTAEKTPTSMHLDPDLWGQVGSYASLNGMTKTDVVESALQAYLKIPSQEPKTPRELRNLIDGLRLMHETHGDNGHVADALYNTVQTIIQHYQRLFAKSDA